MIHAKQDKVDGPGQTRQSEIMRFGYPGTGICGYLGDITRLYCSYNYQRKRRAGVGFVCPVALPPPLPPFNCYFATRTWCGEQGGRGYLGKLAAVLNLGLRQYWSIKGGFGRESLINFAAKGGGAELSPGLTLVSSDGKINLPRLCIVILLDDKLQPALSLSLPKCSLASSLNFDH